jgi:two-component system sensor histidine kinase KdpD
LMVAGVTAAAGGLFHVLDLGNVALLYLLPVMAAAVTPATINAVQR